MKTIKGLWIDRRKAVIVAVYRNGEEVKEIPSPVEKQRGRLDESRTRTRYPAQLVPPDDNVQQRHFTDIEKNTTMK